MDKQYQQPKKHTRMSGKERRALMLQRATHIFARSSFAAASTGELARESEVTEPMLYKHFGSKKGFFLEVLSKCGEHVLTALQERLAKRAANDTLDALAHIVIDYRSIIIADPEIQRVLFQAVAETGDSDIARGVSEHNRKIFALIRQLIERAHDEGCLNATINVDAATWGYMSMILALQYGLMLDLSSIIGPLQEETNSIWLRGLLSKED